MKFYSKNTVFQAIIEPKNQKNADIRLYILKKVIEFNYMKTEFYRVLKPQEAKSIIEIIPKMKHKMAFNTALYTGMRFKELHDFSEHADWFNYKRRMIIIPGKFTKTHEERKVNLTPQFSEILYYYLEGGNKLRYPVFTLEYCLLRRVSSHSRYPILRSTKLLT